MRPAALKVARPRGSGPKAGGCGAPDSSHARSPTRRHVPRMLFMRSTPLQGSGETEETLPMALGKTGTLDPAWFAAAAVDAETAAFNTALIQIMTPLPNWWDIGAQNARDARMRGDG